MGPPQSDAPIIVSPQSPTTLTPDVDLPAPASSAIVLPGAAPEPPSVIEQLIERITVPAPLPGLEFRLLSPEEAASATRPPSDAAPDRRPAPTDDARTSGPGPTLPPAPPLDINAVADKVHEMLSRRQRHERERKGVY
jgi:hypothetical protein